MLKTVAEFFAGIGLMRLGLEQAGWEVAFANARQILLEVGKGEVNIRLLSPRECARLMGADDYTLPEKTNDALFGFGDAVCVPVVKWIGENYLNPVLDELKSFAEDNIKKSLSSFFHVYNERVDAVEVDKSLLFDIPMNLRRS